MRLANQIIENSHDGNVTVVRSKSIDFVEYQIFCKGDHVSFEKLK